MSFDVLENLSAKALESVRSAIIVVDAIDPEHPIVYMNPAFKDLTGYGPEDVLGRNCRFLQGTDRSQEARNTIREALWKECPVRAVLRNYRKDGSLFYNELFIDPIRDPDGAVIHFVGCQNAVTDQDAAVVRQRALVLFERLTPREREVFEMVVNGFSNKATATEFGISERTAEKHRMRILKKLEVSDLTHLVRYAIALAIPFKVATSASLFGDTNQSNDPDAAD